jgi:DNA polymerase
MHAPLMLVGEQPGDEEERRGKPFVGPAGKVLDKLCKRAGLERSSVYVTNAVKHFKWLPRGKRRLHAKPTASEIRTCHPWLLAEIANVSPEVIVCLGASAAQAVLREKTAVRASAERTLHGPGGIPVIVTYHPSAALRAPTQALRSEIQEAIVSALRRAVDAARVDTT